MQRGPKPKPSHLKVVEGTFRPDRSMADEGPAIAVPERPKFLKRRAAVIWDQMVAKHPKLTEYQIANLAPYCSLRAAFETDPESMPTARMVEMRRLSELLLAPRGKPDQDAKEKLNPADRFFAGPTKAD